MHGLYLLWWVQEQQVPPAIVALSLAAGDLVVFAVEWPTGWFADRHGHRRSLMVGSAVQVLGMLWCWLGQGVPGLVAGSVLIAIGDGFRSGARQALLYRTCVALDREHDYQRLEARSAALETTALAALVLCGGVIVQWSGFDAAWLAETLLCALGLVAAATMTEPPAAAEQECDAGPVRPAGRAQAVTAAILPASLLGAFAGMAAFLAQTAPSITPATATWLVAGITLTEAAGSAAAARVAATQGVQVVLAVAGALLLCTGLLVPPSMYAVVPALALLLGVAEPLRATRLQRMAPDDARARIASAASACDMAVAAVALPLAGVWQQRRR